MCYCKVMCLIDNDTVDRKKITGTSNDYLSTSSLFQLKTTSRPSFDSYQTSHDSVIRWSVVSTSELKQHVAVRLGEQTCCVRLEVWNNGMQGQ